jgi:hypothetical protein
MREGGRRKDEKGIGEGQRGSERIREDQRG